MAQPTLATQQFVEVKEIKDGVVYLKNGSTRRILIVGGVNFELKSAKEQEGILAAFQNFLNTLDFSLQFFIHSRKVNIETYLKRMTDRKLEEDNELLKIQIDDYIEFVKSFVEQNPILHKTFFVVVPYDTIAFTSEARGLFSIFKTSSAAPQVLENKEKQKNLMQLNQRVEEVAAGLETIGIHAKPMEDEELTELFYNLYNPQLVEKKDLQVLKTIAVPQKP